MKNIKKLVKKSVRQMQEVNWGDIPANRGARLLWGENPLCPEEAVKAVVAEANRINFYPSPTKIQLKKQVAKYNGVSTKNIVVTNGSDDAIELIAKVFLSEKDEVIIPVPSFPVYSSVSLMMGARIKAIPLENDFSLNIKKIVKKVSSQKTKLIFIANPNNPTGNLLMTVAQIEDLAKKVNCMLIIDECYFELSKTTVAGLVKKYPNILVIRSFSKVFGLAGVRLGYIIANKKVTKYLNRVQMANQPFSVNRLAQAAALSILRDGRYVASLIEEYLIQKKNFETLLSQIENIEVIRTKTTFCLLKLKATKESASSLKKKLEKKKIFIKDCSMYKRLGSEYVYLGVPIKQYQNDVVKTIKNILR